VSGRSAPRERQVSSRPFRWDFQENRWLGVRIQPGGFEIEDALHPDIVGRVRSCTRIRKLFEEGLLACHSNDGIRSDKGVECETCKHTMCRPLLRIQIQADAQIYLIDLPYTSARNLIRLEDELQKRGQLLAGTDIRAEVVNRGYWGEVVFRTA